MIQSKTVYQVKKTYQDGDFIILSEAYDTLQKAEDEASFCNEAKRTACYSVVKVATTITDIDPSAKDPKDYPIACYDADNEQFIDPGEGYRLLKVGENTSEGDQLFNPLDEWLDMAPWDCGRTIHDGFKAIRRKI
jgi:hypothetical protein